jgi:hypothetical protein
MAVAVFLFLTGCSHLGPQTVPRDRFDYNMAISNSWKEQTLLNIVKLRYADMPLFVEVASVVSGYTLESSVSLGGDVSSKDAVQGDFFSLNTGGKFTDRPTITYAPITGRKFNESFMTPIPPRAILFLMQTGWPVDVVFPMTVDSINGLRSQVAAGTNQRLGDPDFYRLVSLLREVQKSGAVGMRIVKGKDQKETTVLFFHRKNITPEITAALREVNRLLGLNTERQETSVVYGLISQGDEEIAMLTRSTLQIMVDLATQIDVPPEHVAQGRTVSSLMQAQGIEAEDARLINVKTSAEKPENAFTAVKYRDYWFWIDDRDFKSKRTFAFVMILFSLMETGGKEGLPLVTIPAG